VKANETKCKDKEAVPVDADADMDAEIDEQEKFLKTVFGQKAQKRRSKPQGYKGIETQRPCP